MSQRNGTTKTRRGARSGPDDASGAGRRARLYLLLALLVILLGLVLWRIDAAARLQVWLAGFKPPVTYDDRALRAERIEMRLLRSIFTGTFQGVTREELVRLAETETETDAASVAQDPDSPIDPVPALARAALLVLDPDAEIAAPSVEERLDRLLEPIHTNPRSDLLPPPTPPGYGEDDLVFTLVHALTLAGRAAAAQSILERHLEIGSQYKKSILAQSIYNLGTAAGKRQVKKLIEVPDLYWLANNLATDLQFPFASEVETHWGSAPPGMRTRATLFRLARGGCGRVPDGILAIYLLGYLAPADNEQQERRELELLRDLSRYASCYNGRLFATRALALRSAETPRFWASLFEAAGNAWERRTIARVAFARHGRDFADPALDFLSREPEKYVQWELMSGATSFRAGVAYRDYWDVWFSAPHSQYRLQHPASWRNLTGKDLAAVLDWLEAGHRPSADAVLDSMLSDLARGATGVGTRRYLSYLSELEDFEDRYWVVQELADPEARPYLEYWRNTFPAGKDREAIERALRWTSDQMHTGGKPCCRATEECLLGWYRYRAGDIAITSAEQAAVWLAGRQEPVAERLGGSATDFVVRSPGVANQTWQHRGGCWQRGASG